MRTWIDVAVLAKCRNSKGRFAVRATAGLPFLLEPGDEVAFVPPRTDMPRRAIVDEVRETGEDSADVLFAEIQDRDVAQALVGSHCLIRRELVDEEALRQAPAIWDGWEVVDEVEGPIGHVAGFVQNPGQSLVEVERPGGKTALIPVVDEIVLDVDPEARLVRVAVPNGLLDL